MRNVVLASLLAILVCPLVHAAPVTTRLNLGELQLVAQLPEELPQRVMGLAYDGQKFWVPIYLGRGVYATLDRTALVWTIVNDEQRHRAIRDVAGAYQSPGAICFANEGLWIAGAYGESFGMIDQQDWKIKRIFKGKQRADRASQFYSSMAFDGRHLWIVWHWFRYDLPTSDTQLLLKIDPETGKVVAEYPVPPGTRPDGVHGLTWDGSMLWHAKDNRLSAIDPTTGQVTASYRLNEIKRPSGLAWDGEALWIVQFDGKIWRLPFFAE
jgi:hypothetical protein